MFNRIVMDVIHVVLEILLVANRVFPKAALPHIVFTSGVLSDRGTGIR